MNTDPKVTKDVVKHIAGLAMIDLSDEELEKYQKQIDSIVEYVRILEKVNTDNVVFSSHVDHRNSFREDVPTPSLTQEAATQNRKDSIEKGAFTITSVLHEE